jgi:putative FmdB family regulatory protein
MLEAARISLLELGRYEEVQSGMPIYEYACHKCGDQLEVLQKMSDKPLSRCRKCGGRLERVLSPSSFQFKGSGWYVTDYARKSDVSKSSASKPSESSSDSGKPSESGKKSD